MEAIIIYLPIIMAVIGLLYMAAKKSWVLKQDAGDGKMKEISDHIYEGALAFLKAEYRLLTLFVIGVCAFIYRVYNSSFYTLAYCYCIYCRCIFLCFGRKYGNEDRHQNKCSNDPSCKNVSSDALKVSFGGGTVMGLGVAGLSVLGLTFSLLFFITSLWEENGQTLLT